MQRPQAKGWYLSNSGSQIFGVEEPEVEQRLFQVGYLLAWYHTLSTRYFNVDRVLWEKLYNHETRALS